jgi:hypothetical protein
MHERIDIFEILCYFTYLGTHRGWDRSIYARISMSEGRRFKLNQIKYPI